MLRVFHDFPHVQDIIAGTRIVRDLSAESCAHLPPRQSAWVVVVTGMRSFVSYPRKPQSGLHAFSHGRFTSYDELAREIGMHDASLVLRPT